MPPVTRRQASLQQQQPALAQPAPAPMDIVDGAAAGATPLLPSRCTHAMAAVAGWVRDKILDPRRWTCEACTTTESVWACLTCGHVGCGRFNAQHAAAHFASTQHPLVLEINGKLAFCYACNDYVVASDADQAIHALRTDLHEIQADRPVVAVAAVATAQSRMPRPPLLRSDSVVAQMARTRVRSERDDKIFAADQHFHLVLLTKVLQAWKGLCEPEPTTPSTSVLASSSSIRKRKSEDEQTINGPTAHGVRKLALPGQTGLRNLGNTCFLNVCLQVLSNVPTFRSYFLRLYQMNALARRATMDVFPDVTGSLRKRGLLADKGDENAESLVVNLHNLLRVMWSLNCRWPVVSPSGFLWAVWHRMAEFRGFLQHDAEEFFCILLDRLDEELRNRNALLMANDPLFRQRIRRWPDKPISPLPKQKIIDDAPKQTGRTIVSMFCGSTLSTFECTNCRFKTLAVQPFSTLSLTHLVQIAANKGAEPSSANRTSVGLYECLDSLVALEDVHAVTCDGCQAQHRRSRVTRLHVLPEVLILHISRIFWLGAQRTKIQTKVTFPLIDLDLSSYLHGHFGPATKDDPDLYDLVAVVEHHGRHFGSGHYTSFCFSSECQSWLSFSDSKVAYASPEEVAASNAYMLVYMRQATRKGAQSS